MLLALSSICREPRATVHQVAWKQPRRVVRGGSWNNNDNNARADYRNNRNPNNRNNNIGFRVVGFVHVLLVGTGLTNLWFALAPSLWVSGLCVRHGVLHHHMQYLPTMCGEVGAQGFAP
jgi:hypothetical protein